MKIKVCVLVFVAALVIGFGWRAFAAAAFTDCRDPATPTGAVGTTNDLNVGLGDELCYQFDDTTDSGLFHVQSPNALICFDPDSGGVAGTARVMPQKCPYGVKGSLTAANSCVNILDAALDGVGGSSATQNACIRVKRGSYRLDVTAAPTAGEEPIASMLGEGS